jgi:hypothetical protein
MKCYLISLHNPHMCDNEAGRHRFRIDLYRRLLSIICSPLFIHSLPFSVSYPFPTPRFIPSLFLLYHKMPFFPRKSGLGFFKFNIAHYNLLVLSCLPVSCWLSKDHAMRSVSKCVPLAFTSLAMAPGRPGVE